MPRVVPSQVVAVIEGWFPSDIQRRQEFSLNRENAGQLMAIIDLAEQIPQELITVEARDYNDLVIGINIIRSAFPQWQMRDLQIRGVPGYSGTNPITLIHQALLKCPDQFPSPETASLSFIQPDDLRKNLQLDISAANRALANSEWKAATVLAGSIVEVLLLWGLQQQNPSTVTSTASGLVGTSLQQKPAADLERWHLPEYIEISAALSIISSDTATQARLAKDFRNLIHPGRAARLGQTCDRGTALSAMAAVEHVVRDLTP
jgi:hypothetical protein